MFPDEWVALDQQAAKVINALKILVEAFDSEDGLPEKVCEATQDILTAQMGHQAGYDFFRSLDATDGKFYFKNSAICQSTVQKIFGE